LAEFQKQKIKSKKSKVKSRGLYLAFTFGGISKANSKVKNQK